MNAALSESSYRKSIHNTNTNPPAHFAITQMDKPKKNGEKTVHKYKTTCKQIDVIVILQINAT